MCQLPRDRHRALTGNAEFIVSKNFVIRSSIEHSQRCDFFLDGSNFLEIYRPTLGAKLGLERTDYSLRQSDAHLLADLLSEFMGRRILDVKRAHEFIINHGQSRGIYWHHKMFTARAASSATVASEISACTIIINLAQRESTGTSVGEKAVLVLNARNR